MSTSTLPEAEVGRSSQSQKRALLGARRRRRFGVVAALVVVGAATIVSLLTAQVGVAGNHRANPDPQFTHVVGDGVGRGHAPLWGIDNFPVVATIFFLFVVLAVVVPLAWNSWRQGRVHDWLLVYGAATAIFLFDPYANWASYTVYDPRFLHFPLTWPWANLSPMVEPLMVVPGYPFFFVTIALIHRGLFMRLVWPRCRPQGWVDRHPMWALFIFGFAGGFLWDIAVELTMMRGQLYYFSQWWGPAFHWDFAALPLTDVHLMAFCIGSTTAMLWRDDQGRSAFARVARRSRWLERRGRLGAFLAGVGLMTAMYLVANAGYTAIRVTGIANNSFSGPPRFEETKLYDPEGLLRAKGHPGPFYDDFWDEPDPN